MYEMNSEIGNGFPSPSQAFTDDLNRGRSQETPYHCGTALWRPNGINTS